MRLLPILVAALLAGCVAAGDTPPAPAPAQGPGIWRLVAIDGAPPRATITLAFAEGGRVVGEAPCNTYFAATRIDGDRIAVSDIGATRRACDRLDEEGRYLNALSRVTRIERRGVMMVLSGGGARLEYATPVN